MTNNSNSKLQIEFPSILFKEINSCIIDDGENNDNIRYFDNIFDHSLKYIEKKSQLEELITYIDLTTLSGDDTRTRINKLIDRALHPINSDVIHCASICIYPARIKDAIRRFKELNTHLPIACVAGGFPSGQYLFETRLLEVRRAIEHGANEIDVVIDRSLVLDGDWEQLFSEIRQFKDVCAAGNVHLKVILSTGELATKRNIYDASMTAMMAGADFIKTSTGKEVTNATLESAFVMCKAIKRYHALTGRRVGFKPAGGIKTAEQAAQYLLLVRDLLGQEWATPTLFRIGASSLLDDICEKLATP